MVSPGFEGGLFAARVITLAFGGANQVLVCCDLVPAGASLGFFAGVQRSFAVVLPDHGVGRLVWF